jgi:hypothetical protein
MVSVAEERSRVVENEVAPDRPKHIGRSTPRASRQPSQHSLSMVLAFIFGVVFISALLLFVLIVPNPTDQQFEVIRIVLALAAGGIAAVIPGFLNLHLGVVGTLVLRAGGALAVFAVVYFYSPAHWTGSGQGSIHEQTKEGKSRSPPLLWPGGVALKTATHATTAQAGAGGVHRGLNALDEQK